MPDRAVAGEWVDIAYAAARLGFSDVTIWRLVDEGVIPSLRANDAVRSTYRLPGQLVEDARRAVMAGGKVVLREFAQDWVARNAVPEGVAPA
jgi:hypothetical protein